MSAALEERFTRGALRLLNTLICKIRCEIPLIFASRQHIGLIIKLGR